MKLTRRLVLAALKFNVSFRANHIAGKLFLLEIGILNDFD
jgi:hypothetical protein